MPTQRPPHAYAEWGGCLRGFSYIRWSQVPRQLHLSGFCAVDGQLPNWNLNCTHSAYATRPKNGLGSLKRSSLEYITVRSFKKNDAQISRCVLSTWNIHLWHRSSCELEQQDLHSSHRKLACFLTVLRSSLTNRHQAILILFHQYFTKYSIPCPVGILHLAARPASA